MPIQRRNLNSTIGKSGEAQSAVSGKAIGDFYDSPSLPPTAVNPAIATNFNLLNLGIVRRNRGIGSNSFSLTNVESNITPTSPSTHPYTVPAGADQVHQENTKIIRISDRPNGSQPIPLPSGIKSIARAAFFFAIGGGGGGGNNQGGGGGAGGAFVGTTPIPFSSVPISIATGSGGGGAGPPNGTGSSGNNSVFTLDGATYTALGGGGGGGGNNPGIPGGCGGGNSKPGTSPRPSGKQGGSGNAGPVATPVTAFTCNGGGSGPYTSPGCGGGGGIQGGIPGGYSGNPIGGPGPGNGQPGREIFGIEMGGGGAAGEGTSRTAGTGGGGPSGGGGGSGGLGGGGGAGGPGPSSNSGGSGGAGRGGYYIDYYMS